MTESILKTLHPRVAGWTLIPSRGGAFEVRAGDHLIFSKKQSHRFPEPDEIIAALSQA